MSHQPAQNSHQPNTAGPNNEQQRQSTVSEPMNDADSDTEKSTPSDARTRLYEYVIPEKEGLSSEEWERKKDDAIKKAIDNDLKKYGFGDSPSDAKSAETWRLENQTALFRKVKQEIYAYHEMMKELPKSYTDQQLDHCIDEIEEEEDSYELIRPRDMTSHKAWSEERKRQKQKVDDEERDDETTREAELQAAGGPPKGWDKGLESTIVEIRNDVPDGIRAIHRTMCMLIFQWWEGGFKPEDSKDWTNLNSQLDTIEGGKAFKVPPTEIALWMPKLKLALQAYEQGPSEAGVMEVLKTAITLTNKLRKPGLDWKMVISRDAHRRFFSCINEGTSEEAQEMRFHFEAEYLKPRPDQVKELASLAHITPFLVGGSPDSKDRIRLENLPQFMEQVRTINQRVQLCNSKLALHTTDHNLPIHDLELAFRCYIDRKTSEAIDCVSKFAYKTHLLNIEGLMELNSACNSAKGIVDTVQAMREVLDLSTTPQLSQLVEDIPSLSHSTISLAFQGVPVKTVAWGNAKGRFYINQYGPQNAPAWRIETQAAPEWTLEFGNEPPQLFCITNALNRFGDEIISPEGKPKYGLNHVGNWYAVAFEGSLADIDPRNYDKDYSLPRCYILLGWDPKQLRMNYEKKWETRTTIRRLYKAEADIMIYNKAVEIENRLREYMKKGVVQGTPEQVYRQQEQSIKKEGSEKTAKEADYNILLPIRVTPKRNLRRKREFADAESKRSR